MQRLKKRSRRGDTLIEVLFAITIFSLVATITINSMNGGVYTAQKSLEITMARNEIDAQAEAIRYVHNSFLAERELPVENQQFRTLWRVMTTRNAQTVSNSLAQSFNNMSNCQEAKDSLAHIGAFVLNTRLIQPETVNGIYEDGGTGVSLSYNTLMLDTIIDATNAANNRFRVASLYPRIIYSKWGSDDINDSSSAGKMKEGSLYRRVASVEGIWVVAMRPDTTSPQPEYYDFHIRTCWHSVGRRAPSTIGTIVRLYNPEVIETEG